MGSGTDRNRRGKLELLATLILFLGVMFAPTPAGMPPVAQRMAAVTVLMAMLWLTQLLPLAVTSLIPIVLFPFFGIQTAGDVSAVYMNKSVFLFLGGFIIAMGIERTGLHRRMALQIIKWIGTSPRRLVMGFMLATAFLSMWISNTASSLLMMPIGVAMLGALAAEQPESEQSDQLGIVLLLGIAYSASIGGMMTLVGTPTNVSFIGIWESSFPDAPPIGAGQWMAAWVPVGGIILVCIWGVLTFRLPRGGLPATETRELIRQKLAELGPLRGAEKKMLAVFVTTALLWIFRVPLKFGDVQVTPGWQQLVEHYLLRIGTDPTVAAKAVHDSTVAIGMAILMFCIPIDRNEDGSTQFLMDWETAERLPWSILLLVGGGFAIAGGFVDSGLANWSGELLASSLDGIPLWALILVICLLLTFLTEFTTNVATVNTILPILVGTAAALDVDPRFLMVPAVVSASCAFMLPIATPPNAIVFSSGQISMAQMARYGLLLNLMCAVIVTVGTFVLLCPIWGINPTEIPDWLAAP